MPEDPFGEPAPDVRTHELWGQLVRLVLAYDGWAFRGGETPTYDLPKEIERARALLLRDIDADDIPTKRRSS